MSAVLRKALFWLLMLVLPLHGIAASIVPLHAIGHGAAQMQQGLPEVAGSGLDVALAQSAATDCVGMLAGCDHPQVAGLFKCGLSAVCALVAVPDLQRSCFLQAQASQAPVAALPQLQVAFCTGAPERPPRFFS